MALSPEFIAQLEEEVLPALRDHYVRRALEIDRDARNLEEYGAPISDLGELTTEAGTDEAISILNSIGAAVT